MATEGVGRPESETRMIRIIGLSLYLLGAVVSVAWFVEALVVGRGFISTYLWFLGPPSVLIAQLLLKRGRNRTAKVQDLSTREPE